MILHLAWVNQFLALVLLLQCTEVVHAFHGCRIPAVFRVSRANSDPQISRWKRKGLDRKEWGFPFSCVDNGVMTSKRCLTKPRAIPVANDGIEEDMSSTSSRRVDQIWNDFVSGADYVHHQFFDFFWQYSCRQPLTIIAPIFVLLALIQLLLASRSQDIIQGMSQLLLRLFEGSRYATWIVRLPLESLVWICQAVPTYLVISLDYLPGQTALTVVRTLLYVQNRLRDFSDFIPVVVAKALLWRPLIAEFQYRFLIQRLFGRIHKISSKNNTPKVEFIPLTGGERLGNMTTTGTDDAEFPEERPLWVTISCLIFATSQLKWITPDSYSLAGFFQSGVAHFSGYSLAELRPYLETMLLMVALFQSISTFLLSWHVLSPLYLKAGLAASFGGHVSWMFGLMTIPFRLGHKLFRLSTQFKR